MSFKQKHAMKKEKSGGSLKKDPASVIENGKAKEKEHESSSPLKDMKSKSMHSGNSGSIAEMNAVEGFGNADHHMKMPDLDGDYDEGYQGEHEKYEKASHGHILKDGYLSEHMGSVSQVGKKGQI